MGDLLRTIQGFDVQDEQPPAPTSAPVRAALAATEGLDPAKTARLSQLARDLGLPENLALEAPERTEEEYQSRTLSRNPALADWAGRNRGNAVYARANAEALAGLFDELGRPIDYQHRLEEEYNFLDKGAWAVGKGFTETGVAMAATYLATMEKQIRDMEAGYLVTPNDYFPGGISMPVDPDNPVDPTQTDEYAKLKAEAASLRQALVHYQGADVKPLEADNVVGQFAMNTLQAGPQLLGAVGSSVVGPVGPAAFMGSQIFGGQYLSLTEEGVDPERAARAGALNMAVQTPLERIGLSRFFKVFKVKGWGEAVKRAGEAVATDVVTEGLQGIPELLTEKWAKEEDFTAKEVFEAVGQGMYEGLTLAPYSLLGGGVTALRARREEGRAKAWTERQTQLYEQAQTLLPDKGGDPAALESALLASGPEMQQLVFLPFSGLEAAAREGVDLVTPLRLEAELQSAESDRVFSFPAATLQARLDPQQFAKAMKSVRRSIEADSLTEAARKSDLSLEETARRAAAENAARAQGTVEAANEEMRAGIRERIEARRTVAETETVAEEAEADVEAEALGAANLNAQVVETYLQTALEAQPEVGAAFKTDLLDALGFSLEDWNEAVAAGRDLAVDLDAALPLMVDNVLGDGLVDLLRLETAEEFQAREALLAEVGLPPKILDRAGADVNPRTRAGLVKRLKGAGRGEGQAKREMEILSRLASTLARVTGQDPNRMIKEGFRFGKEAKSGGGVTYHQEAEKRRRFESLPSPEVNSETVKNITSGDGFIRNVIDWVESLGIFGKYDNADSGLKDILFDRASVKSVVKHQAQDGKVALLTIAPEMIKNGVFLEAQARNEQGLLSHIFASKATVDGVPYVVGFVVREDVNGKRYYDHSMTEIKALSGPETGGKARGNTARSKPVNRESVLSIVQKHLGVKPDVFLQSDASGPHGWTELLSDGSINIIFTQSQNASTAVHEFAHAFRDLIARTLDLPADQIADQSAFNSLKEGWTEVEAWLGRFDDESALAAEYDKYQKETFFGGRDFADLTAEEGTEARERAKHEYFARGFEAYLLEGQAPSSGLKKIFAQMKKWLGQLYLTVQGLDVELNDDVRQFFDRMLATEEELLAESWRGDSAFSSEEMEALREADPVLAERAATASARAREEAEKQIISARLKEHEKMRRQWRREAKAAAREDERWQRVDDIVERGGINLDSLRAGGYEANTIRALNNIRPGLVREDGRLGYDELAEEFGFTEGGDAFVSALLETPGLKRLEEDYLAEREAEFAEYFDLEAGITEAEINAYEEEHKLWSKFMGEKYRPGSVQALRAAIKAEADQASIDELIRLNQKEWKKRLKDVQKEARDVLKEARGQARLDRRLAVAGERFKAKKRLLEMRLEMALRYQEQTERAREIAKFEARAKKLMKQKVAESAYKPGGIRPDFHSQIKNILSAAGFSGQRMATEESLGDFVSLMQADGIPVDVAPDIINGTMWEKAGQNGQARRRTYRSLSWLEFSDLRDAVENLDFLGRQAQTVRVDGLRQSESAVAAALINSIAAEHEIIDPESASEVQRERLATGTIEQAKLRWKKWRKRGTGLMPSTLKWQHMAYELDGQKLNGVAQRTFYSLIDQATNKELILTQQYMGRFKEIIESTVGAKAWQAWSAERIYFPEYGEFFSRAQVIAAALNSGNIQNLTALNNHTLFKGRGAGALLKKMSSLEWDFVQSVWDFMDNEVFPELDSLTRRTKGVRLKKVEANPFDVTLADGSVKSMRGGYYPLHFDKRGGSAPIAASRERTEELLSRPTLFNPQNIQASSTIARNGKDYHCCPAN